VRRRWSNLWRNKRFFTLDGVEVDRTYRKGAILMNANLQAGKTLLVTLLACGLAACTTQEANSTGSGGTVSPGTSAAGGSSSVPAGTGGASGAGGESGSATGLGTLCPAPKQVISDFTYTPDTSTSTSTSAPRFGSAGTLQGGGSFYPESGANAIKSDLTQGNWHLTGTVGDYTGFGLYFDLCDRVDASAFKGISFTVSGNVTSITFGVGTADDTPTGTWMLSPGGKTTAKASDAGKCTPTSGTQYYHPGCGDPTAQIPVTATATPQKVTWTSLTGGTPVSSPNPKEITSIYWYFPWTAGQTPYALDFTIDDLSFIP
jgi:hypothetical protein